MALHSACCLHVRAAWLLQEALGSAQENLSPSPHQQCPCIMLVFTKDGNLYSSGQLEHIPYTGISTNLLHHLLPIYSPTSTPAWNWSAVRVASAWRASHEPHRLTVSALIKGDALCQHWGGHQDRAPLPTVRVKGPLPYMVQRIQDDLQARHQSLNQSLGDERQQHSLQLYHQKECWSGEGNLECYALSACDYELFSGRVVCILHITFSE